MSEKQMGVKNILFPYNSLPYLYPLHTSLNQHCSRSVQFNCVSPTSSLLFACLLVSQADCTDLARVSLRAMMVFVEMHYVFLLIKDVTVSLFSSFIISFMSVR